MKKMTLTCCAGMFLLSIALSVKAQTINFPDDNFKQALLNHIPDIDTDDDDEISQEEAEAFTGMLDVSDKNIEDLTGIEYFTNITKLDCDENQLTSLNLSQNTALTQLFCDDNNLSSLLLSNNEWLSFLECNRNQLSTLDLSACPNIEVVRCDLNRLSSLIFNDNTIIARGGYLWCDNNKFTFSALAYIKDHYPRLDTYESDSTIFSAQTGSYGFEVDYSAEVSINGKTTSFTWYDDSDNEVEPGFVQEQGTPGVFRFLKAGIYYCKMTNPAFPGLELQTKTISIAGTEKQTITFHNLPALVEVKSNLELSVSADSGLEVSLELLTNNASLDGNTITFTEAGDVTIRAYNDGDAVYAPTDITATVTVIKKTQDIINFNPPAEAKVNDGIELIATATSGLEVSFEVLTDNASIDGSTITFTEAGDVTIRAFQNGNDEYGAANEQTATVTVSKKTQDIINFNPPAEAKVNDEIELIATATSGLEVSFEVLTDNASIDGSTITFTEAGDVTIRAFQDGNDEYGAANEQTATVTVSKKTQDIINFNPPAEAKVNDEIELIATATSGLEVSFEVLTDNASIDGSTITFTEAGDVTIRAYNNGDAVYAPADMTATVPVIKKTQTISFQPLTEVKVNDEIELIATVTSGLEISFEVREGNASLHGNSITFNEAGNVTIRAYHDGNAEYAATEKEAIISISKRTEEISFSPGIEAKVKDVVQLSATADSGLEVSFEVAEGNASLEGNSITFKEAGSVTIRAYHNGNIEYAAAEKEVRISVSKKDQSISFTPAMEVDINEVLELSAVATSSLEVSFAIAEGNAILDGNTITFTEEGSVTVRAYQDGNAEYLSAEKNVVFTISPHDEDGLPRSSISIYPNPVGDVVNILFADDSPKTIRIYNLEGRLLIQTEAFAKKTIDVSGLRPALYILKVKTEEGIFRFKISKVTR